MFVRCLLVWFLYFFVFFFFFFFNDTATTEIYTLSLHDSLPISPDDTPPDDISRSCCWAATASDRRIDRKSTRLNSSHVKISYAVFCLKKKKKNQPQNLYKNKKTTNKT